MRFNESFISGAGFKAYEIEPQKKPNWDVIEYSQASSFTTWAIRQAANIVLREELANNNNWWWCSGNFVCKYKDYYYYLGMTENNILVLRAFNCDNMEINSMYRINME